MVKFFKIGTIIEQGSDSKLLNNHLEPELQDETQNEDGEPKLSRALARITHRILLIGQVHV